MGQEIVYCFKCQTRIVGAEFDKGAAFQVGNNVSCSKCVAELLPTLPPKDREQLLAKMFKATHERRLSGSTASLPVQDAPLSSSSAKMRVQQDPNSSASARARLAPAQGPPGGHERRKSSDTARRRWAQSSSRNMGLAALAAFVLAAAVFLMMKSGGNSGTATTARPVVGGTTTTPSDGGKSPIEHEEVRKARDFARANPKDLDGQISAWRNAQLVADRPPDSDVIKRELERLLALQGESIRSALAEIDTQTKTYLDKEEFVLAASILRSARTRYAAPEWTLAIDKKIDAARDAAVKLLPALKEKAADARKRGATEEMKALQARVNRWGHPDLLREFEAILAENPDTRPATPITDPAPTPALSKEVEAYRVRWDVALARAVLGDTTGASQDLSAALEGVKDAAVRAEAAEDLEALRRVGLAMQEIKELVARTPKGQKVSLERWNDVGAPDKVEGTVVGSEPGRLLVKTDAAVLPVPIGELTPGLISDLFATRAARKPGDERSAAFLAALAGDLDRAARLKVELPDRWRRFASKAPAAVNAGSEAEARRLYAEAEDTAADPTRVATAVKNYKTLLSDFGTTAFVGRNRAILNSKSNLGKEYLFYAEMLRGFGTFRFGKAGKMESAWLSEKDSESAAAPQNFVELSFTALTDTEYRLWVYAGACCLETFAFGLQGTDMTLPTAKTSLAEPGSAVVIPVRPTPSLKKTHASHMGPKNPARWEWIPIQLPKYASPGVKVVRLLTDQQGFAVAYASVSGPTSSAPRESEIKEYVSLRRPERPPEREVPGLVAYWPLDEGAGTTITEATGKGYIGTIHGATWTTGRSGKGLHFDGGDSWVDLPRTPALDNIAEGSYTIMAWFQPDELPSAKIDDNTGAYAIVIRSGYHSGLSFKGDSSFTMVQWFGMARGVAASRALPPKVFYHVAGVVDRSSGTVSLFVNGRPEGSGPFDPTAKPYNYEATPWRIGNGRPGFDSYRWCAKGTIDEVRFYNRALSATEIDAASRQGVAAPKPLSSEVPGLVAYWPMDEGSGTTITEGTGKGLVGTIQGPVTWAAGRYGKGLRFDGGKSWVELPNSPVLDNLAEGSFTMMAWFYPDSLPPGKDTDNTSAYGILSKTGVHSGLRYVNTGSYVMMYWFLKTSDPTQRVISSMTTRSFPAATFYHVAAIIDRSTGMVSTVINGKVEAVDKFDPAARPYNYGTTPWRVGIAGPNDDAFRWCTKGIIDEVRFYNRALSPAEVDAASRLSAATPALKASATDKGPWKQIFDGQTINCIVSEAANAWRVVDGCLANIPGVDNAGQTREEFADGELRIRLESRGNSNLWFLVRQNGPSGYYVNLRQLGDLMNQKDHEIVFTMRGPTVTATLDGKPAQVDIRAPSAKGIIQFNCSTDGTLRIRSIEYRP